jgi:hypothetical protein
MNRAVAAIRIGVGCLALLLLLALPAAPRVSAAEPDVPQLTTRFFTIYYPAGEEQTANWYAGFVDDMDSTVSELLGADPVTGLILVIYNTEAEYTAANPLAELHPGVLAHAIPDRKEIGVAVERLRAAPPELARESFRHEMTHVVAGALSNQELPIGFQEGLAQYNELSDTRADEVVKALQAAQAQGVDLLSWDDLTNTRRFQRQLDVAYPESYTVMAFLADRYGMGAYTRFLAGLRAGHAWSAALAEGFGVSAAELEAQWRDWLPGFFSDGWRKNVLRASDLAPGRALYDAGQFAEAAAYFKQSEALYRDLGRMAQLTAAMNARVNAERAQQATQQATAAGTALAAHDYAGAQQQATTAAATFAALQLTDRRNQAASIAGQAAQGVQALATLDRARLAQQGWRVADAEQAAREAGAALAALGDAPRVAEANRILADIWGLERAAGLAALGVGALALLGGALAAGRRRWRTAKLPRPPAIPEETASWL